MSDRNRFFTVGSPLQGRVIPYGWFDLDQPAKARCVVANGWAPTYAKALGLLARHNAAVRAQRKAAAAAKARAGWKFSPED